MDGKSRESVTLSCQIKWKQGSIDSGFVLVDPDLKLTSKRTLMGRMTIDKKIYRSR